MRAIILLIFTSILVGCGKHPASMPNPNDPMRQYIFLNSSGSNPSDAQSDESGIQGELCGGTSVLCIDYQIVVCQPAE